MVFSRPCIIDAALLLDLHLHSWHSILAAGQVFAEAILQTATLRDARVVGLSAIRLDSIERRLVVGQFVDAGLVERDCLASHRETHWATNGAHSNIAFLKMQECTACGDLLLSAVLLPIGQALAKKCLKFRSFTSDARKTGEYVCQVRRIQAIRLGDRAVGVP